MSKFRADFERVIAEEVKNLSNWNFTETPHPNSAATGVVYALKALEETFTDIAIVVVKQGPLVGFDIFDDHISRPLAEMIMEAVDYHGADSEECDQLVGALESCLAEIQRRKAKTAPR